MPKLFLVLLLTTNLYAARVAITMDDFAMRSGNTLSLLERDEAILAALDRHKVKAAAFVTGKYIEKPEVSKRLRVWDEKGHLIANHTFSHLNFNRTELSVFAKDILRCESLIRGFKHFEKRFRFPYLKAGNTQEKRDGIRAFLKEQGYRNGYVTIDAWIGTLRAVLRRS
ncbi:MAG: polysaccharide deacetylase family protein [Bdellovibrionota bacterium]